MARSTSPLAVTQGQGTNTAWRDLSGGTYTQGVDSAPWEPTQLAGAQRLVVGTSVVGTTLAGAGGSPGTVVIPAGATHLYMSVEGAGVGMRFWNTGDTPTVGTAGAGHFLSTGAGPLEFDNIALLKMVTADATTASTVQLSYHKYI